MSEYEAYWLAGFQPINSYIGVPRNNYGNLKKANKQVRKNYYNH